MTQTELNIAVLTGFLKENGIAFEMNRKVGKVVADILIPSLRIAVRYGDDQDFFNAVKHTNAPFFIRETENGEKTLEKIQNCCIMQMQKLQELYLKGKNKTKNTAEGK